MTLGLRDIESEKQCDESTETVEAVTGPQVEFNANITDFGKTAAGIRDIFDSGDPALISAIQAGVHAFQTSIKREAYIQQQTKEIEHLKKMVDGMKERIGILQEHLIAVDHRKQIRRQKDLGLPGEMEERRSGLERRQQGVVITTMPTEYEE